MATVPTIKQYDAVYAGLRQNSITDYDLLRTYLLSLGPSGSVLPVDINYADLLVLIGTLSLSPGQSYRIQDFRSREVIPETGGVAVQLGGVEPLTITALSVDTLSDLAFSEDFPQDLIYYDITGSAYGGDMGEIYKRIDSERDLSANFDFRNFVFRRWETGPGTRIFTVTSDNGEAFQDVPAFDPSLSLFIDYQSNDGNLPNNVLYGENQGITFEPESSLNTVLGDCQKIIFGPGSRDNVIGTNNAAITLGVAVADILTGDLVLLTYIEGGSARITIGDSCTDLNLGANTEDWTIGDGCNAISCDSGNNNINIGANSTRIVFGNGNDTIDIFAASTQVTFGDNNSTFTTAGVLGDITVANGNAFIDFFDAASRINISDQNLFMSFTGICTDINVLGQSNFVTFDTNTDVSIGINVDTIAILTGANIIQIGERCTGIQIGDNSTNIVIDTGATSITIGQDNQNILMSVGVNARDTLDGEIDRCDYVDRIELTSVWDFAVQGGAIGTIDLNQLPTGATCVNTVMRATAAVTTAGLPGQIDIGPAVDDPTGVLSQLNTAANFDTTVRNADVIWSSQPSYSGLTTAARILTMAISVTALDAGRFYLKSTWNIDV